MKQILLVCALIFSSLSASLAQLPAFTWQQLAGGNSHLSTKFNAIKGTTDGGFIAVGNAGGGGFATGDSSFITGYHYGPFAATDAWVVKFSSTGQVQWGRCYGGSYNDDALGVCLSGDGGYIISRYAQSTDGDLTSVSTQNNTVWIFKIDGTGNLQWSKNLFSTNSGDEGSVADNDIISTNDGGFIVSGSAFNPPSGKGSVDAVLWKLDAGGNITWTKNYGGSGLDYGSHVIQLPDKGYVFTASAASGDGDLTGDNNTTTDTHFWLVRTDSIGTLLWQKVPDPTLPSQETVHDFIKCADNSYALIGADQADVGGTIYFESIFLMHTDSSGNLLWQKNYGNYQSTSGSSGVGWGIIQGGDSSFIIDGQTVQTDASFPNQCYGGFLMKIVPSDGTLIGYQGYPDVPYNVNSQHDNNSFFYGIAKNSAGAIALCGEYAAGTSPYLDSIITAHNWVLSGFVTLVTDATGTLPVTLLSFKAAIVNNQTLLQWATSQEPNSVYFSINRSGDGIHFTPLTTVPAHVNTGVESNYQATDPHPLNGINYYRLTETDKAGKSFYSKIIHVNNDAGKSYSIYPNPVTDRILINITETVNRKVSLELFDENGRLTLSEQTKITTGSNTIEWNISGLPKGSYFLKIKNEDVPVVKIMKN